MSLKYRRLLYSSFIAFFIIVTPLITLYATGYRYNFKNNRIEKIGIIHIETLPKDAKVYINDKYIDDTPARFIKLLPNKYKVVVQKEGYHPWKKEVVVQSNLTSFYKDITLFKNNLPINKIEGQINLLAISPDQKKIIYTLNKQNIEELRLLNIKNNSEFLIDSFNSQAYNQLEFVEWSPNRNKALIKKVIGDFNQYIIVDINSLKIEEIFDITRLSFDKLTWDLLNDNFLYGLKNAVLYQIDLLNDDVESLHSANITDFQIKGNEIFFISKVVNESFLNKTILEDKKIGEIVKIKLPSPSNFTLQPSTQPYLVLLDMKSNDLFIIESNAFGLVDLTQSIILQDKAKEIVWSSDFSEILFYTDFEISTFNFNDKQKNLITRYGEIINQAIWYPGDNYIIYQLGNVTKAIERYGFESRNDVELAHLSEISQISVDDVGENLYFIGQVGNQQGIYKLELQ